MSVSINISEDLLREAEAIAESQKIPVEEVLSSAVEEHLVAWRRLKQRAARGNREKFLKVLDHVPDVEPEDYDRF